MRHERIMRAVIREERLRATAGLREPPALTSWRGRSGRRYVVGIHPANEAEVADLSDAVLIAVQRGEDGRAEMLDVLAPEARSSRRQRLRWLSAMRSRGATELHVHRLAESEAERRAVAADLAVGSP
ncbi:hypothetical protein HJG44_03000 [Enterovirga sp. DB1703]|uniref:Uncharacterized protein n=2 Tax=Enterovirga aerilata TaxID=2730920 RepID=A0A849IBR0_9HYPH|nr:hypothetical protein [Enterovirga sp. DB1703]